MDNRVLTQHLTIVFLVPRFQREIAEIKSVSNHLDVFSTVLSDWIREAVRADEAGLSVSAFDPHCTVFGVTQGMLRVFPPNES